MIYFLGSSRRLNSLRAWIRRQPVFAKAPCPPQPLFPIRLSIGGLQDFFECFPGTNLTIFLALILISMPQVLTVYCLCRTFKFSVRVGSVSPDRQHFHRFQLLSGSKDSRVNPLRPLPRERAQSRWSAAREQYLDGAQRVIQSGSDSRDAGRQIHKPKLADLEHAVGQFNYAKRS